jgi:hypothetical protein
VPTLLVSILTLLMPLLLFTIRFVPSYSPFSASIQAFVGLTTHCFLFPFPVSFSNSKKAETIVTKSELHNVLLSRYYRFLMANIVIFFCIGKTALQSFITKFQNDLLSVSQFPLVLPSLEI